MEKYIRKQKQLIRKKVYEKQGNKRVKGNKRAKKKNKRR